MANSRSYQLESVSCALCGSLQHTVVIRQAKELYNGLPDKFNVVRCNVCGLCFTNPRPTVSTMGFFYPDNAGYFQQEIGMSVMELDDGFGTFLRLYRNYPGTGDLTLLQKLLLPYYTLRADIAAYPYYTGGRLLDVGCSYGKYLLEMKMLGWDTFGLEPHAPSANAAKSAGEIIVGGLEDAPWPNGYFDVVTLNMSLEHMHDPFGALCHVSRLLAPHGVTIIVVPNFSGIEFRLYKEKAYGLQVPQHLYHFTPATLKIMAAKAGLRCQRIRHQYFDRDIIAPLHLAYPRLAKLAASQRVRRFLLKPLCLVAALAGCTSRMSCWFRKTDFGRRE